MNILRSSARKGLLSGLLFLLAVIIAPLVYTQTPASPAIPNTDLGLTPQSPPAGMLLTSNSDAQNLLLSTTDAGTVLLTMAPPSAYTVVQPASNAIRTSRTDGPPITIQPPAPTYRNTAATFDGDVPGAGVNAVTARTRDFERPPMTSCPRQFLVASTAPADRYGSSGPVTPKQLIAHRLPRCS